MKRTYQPVYISSESLYCFSPVDWIGKWIVRNMHLSGTLDLGASNAIKVGKVAKIIKSNSTFKGQIDNQVISKEIRNAPQSKDVVDFIINYKNST